MIKDLSTSTQELPATLGELHEFILVGEEKVNAYQAKLRAVKKVGLAKAIRDQTIREGQAVSEQVMYATVRFGELLASQVRPGNPQLLHDGNNYKLPPGTNKKQSHEAQLIKDHADLIPDVVAIAAEHENIATNRDLLRAIRAELKETENENTRNQPLPPLNGTWRTIVVDPPWPMKKIPREVRPNQVDDLDYPIMSLEDIAALPIDGKMEPASHLYLWTTQKFLPYAFTLIEAWKFDYLFTMVWHKAGGFQPVGLAQFNCEFVIVARRGGLKFLETTDFKTCFEAGRREHSRKPDEFYSLVNRISPGPRLDWFARESHEGFDTYGKETDKF